MHAQANWKIYTYHWGILTGFLLGEVHPWMLALSRWQ